MFFVFELLKVKLRSLTGISHKATLFHYSMFLYILYVRQFVSKLSLLPALWLWYAGWMSFFLQRVYVYAGWNSRKAAWLLIFSWHQFDVCRTDRYLTMRWIFFPHCCQIHLLEVLVLNISGFFLSASHRFTFAHVHAIQTPNKEK